jgi:hypothetical protein
MVLHRKMEKSDNSYTYVLKFSKVTIAYNETNSYYRNELVPNSKVGNNCESQSQSKLYYQNDIYNSVAQNAFAGSIGSHCHAINNEPRSLTELREVATI